MQQYRDFQNKEVELDIKRALIAVWNKKVAVVIVVAVFALAGYLFSRFCLTPLYQSDFTAYINNRLESENTSTSMSASDLNASIGVRNVYREVVQSRAVLMAAAEKCGYDYSYEDLLEMVSCELPDSVAIISVVVVCPDPYEAWKLAMAISEVVPDKLSEVIEGTSMRVIDEPLLPTQKCWPGNVQNGVVCGITAFFAVCLLIIILDLARDRVQNVEELERRHQIPVIGVIPDLKEAEKKRDHYGYNKYSARAEREGKR